MKYYLVTIVDSLTSASVQFSVYGNRGIILVEDLARECIINEYGIPLYIKTIHTCSIVEQKNVKRTHQCEPSPQCD